MNDMIPREENPMLVTGNASNSSQNAMVQIESSRAVAETQAAILLAKRFPRDQIAAMDRILQAFTRPTLAEGALYSYARGGTEITGPSIRTAETLAREWGNLQYGIRELTQSGGESEVEAFCWDMETNVRQVKIFKVRHERHTKQGAYALKDPRDIYELVANQGSRRLRACILGIIPGDVVEAATRQAEATLKTKAEVTPERIKALLEKFGEYGVTQGQIERRIQRRIDAITPALMVDLGKKYNSMRDGMSKASDWFDDGEGAPPADAPPAKQTFKERTVGASEKKPAPPATPETPRNEHSEAPAAPKGKKPPASKEPTVPFDHVREMADKASGPDQADLIRDLIRDPAYTEEQRKEVSDILETKGEM